MKKIRSVLLLIAGIFFLVACEEELRDPVLSLDGGPTVSSPSAVKSYVLSEETAGNVMETYAWSAANFGFPAAVTYTLQFAEANKSFATPINVVSTGNKSFTLKVSELNERLLAMNVPAGALFQMEGRVKATVGDYAPEQYSSVFKFSVVPYESKLPPLYLLGDATLNEWDNNKAQPMPFWSVNVYGIVTPLKANKNIKVIKTLGAWAPQWGQASGTWEAGKLAYRPTESVADPASIPSPTSDGDYLVTVNIEALTYAVTKMPAAVYLVGDGCDAGWDPTKGIAFTKGAPGVYTLTTALKNSGGLKIMYYNTGVWAPQWGTSAGAISAVGKLVFRPNEGSADPASIPVPATAGNYKITLNFSENTYKIAQQ